MNGKYPVRQVLHIAFSNRVHRTLGGLTIASVVKKNFNGLEVARRPLMGSIGCGLHGGCLTSRYIADGEGIIWQSTGCSTRIFEPPSFYAGQPQFPLETRFENEQASLISFCRFFAFRR